MSRQWKLESTCADEQSDQGLCCPQSLDTIECVNGEQNLTLVLLSPDIPYLCKQCRSRSDGFWRSQLIWLCTVCHQVCEFIAKTSDQATQLVKIRSGHGILIYSAGQGLMPQWDFPPKQGGVNPQILRMFGGTFLLNASHMWKQRLRFLHLICAFTAHRRDLVVWAAKKVLSTASRHLSTLTFTWYFPDISAKFHFSLTHHHDHRIPWNSLTLKKKNSLTFPWCVQTLFSEGSQKTNIRICRP